MYYHLIVPLLIWISVCHDFVSSFGVSLTAVQTFSKHHRHLVTTNAFQRSTFRTRTASLLKANALTTDDSLNLSPDSDALVILGMAACSKGKLEKARGLWEDALELDMSNAAAHYQLGLLARRRRYLSEACTFFQRALDVEPGIDKKNNEHIRYELGTLLTEMGYFTESEAIFQDILSREPLTERPSKVKLALANLLLDGRGMRSEALQVYNAAYQAGLTIMAFTAGVTSDSLGEHSAALEYYKKSCNEDAPDEDTALHLIVAYLREGNHDAAAILRSHLPSHVLTSLDYVLATPVAMDPSLQFFTYDMVHLALDNTCDTMEGGLVLEFGVYHGKTIRMIASYLPNTLVHGFDTFSGIPEDWHSLTPKNSYSTHDKIPQAPENVQYHVGLFSDSLPGFLNDHPDKPIRFMNIDCDLYSSTKDIFDAVHGRVHPGTIIIFDEYIMNPHWKEDEYKAFQEAVTEYGWEYKYLGFSLVSQQAIVQII